MDAEVSKDKPIKPSFLERNYKYIIIVLAIVLFLFIISKNRPKIDFIWILVLIAVITAYFIYTEYRNRQKLEDIYKMSEVVIASEEKERGFNLKKQEFTAEEIGKDRWAIEFPERTYTFSPNTGKILEVTKRTISEIRDDIKNSVINTAIAEGKITNIKLES